MASIEASPSSEASSANGFMTLNTRSSGSLSEAMRIDNNGNVGIGTTDPQAKLEVKGYDVSAVAKDVLTVSGQMSTDVYDEGMFAAKIRTYSNYNSLGNGSQGGLLVQAGFSKNIDIARFSSIGSGFVDVPRLVIKDTGNVGIGTTSPDEKLEVDSGSVSIHSDNYTDAGFILDRANYGFKHKVWAQATGVYNSFSTDNFATMTQSLFMKTDGKVGIGTIDPDNNLSIEDSAPTIELSRTSGGIVNGTEIGKLLFTADDDSSGRVREDTAYIRQMGASTWNGSAANSYLGFGIRNNNSTFLDDTMVLDHNGNVGIGTTDPLYSLDVKKTFNTNSDTIINLRAHWANTGNGKKIGSVLFTAYDVDVNSGDSYESAKIGARTSNEWTSTSDINADIFFDTINAGNLSSKMVIKHDGNVGIGTTDPDAKLHVTSSSNTDSGGVVVESSNLGKYTYQYFDSNDTYIIKNGATGFRNISFNPGGTGNVGIGTDTPSQKLEVDGSIAVFRTDGNQPFIFCGDAITDHTRLTYKNGMGVLESFDGNARSNVAVDGKLGVGTYNGSVVDPVKNLEVYYNASTTNKIGTLAGATAGSGLLIRNINSTTNTYANLDFRSGTADGRIALVNKGNNLSEFQFIHDKGGSPSSSMIIDSSGNLGVGYDTPSSRAHIRTGAFSAIPTLGSNGHVAHIGESSYGTLFGTLNTGRGYIQQGRVDGTATAYDLLLQPNGGSVAIGRVSAGGTIKLDVNGRVRTSRMGTCGTYSASEVQGIWSIGESWKIDTANDDFGNQYGMSYAYSTNGGAPLTSQHQIVYTANGTVGGAIGLLGNAYFKKSVLVNITSSTSSLHINKGGMSSIPLSGEGGHAAQIGSSTYGTLFGTLSTGKGYIQQGRVDGTAIDYDLLLQPNGGNVGIGTDSPSAKLEVVDNDYKFNFTQFSGAQIFVPSSITTGWSRSYSLGHDNTYFGGMGYLATGSNPNLLWLDGTGDGFSSYQLVLKEDGNVGIGTDSPSTPLTIKSNSISNSSSGLSIVDSTDTNTLFHLGERSNKKARFHMYNQGVEGIAFYTDGTDNHISYGNLGIGTDSPSEKLEVDGNIKADDFILSSDKNLKENVKDFDKESLDINVKTYELKSAPGVKRTGVIAQELEVEHPEFVRTNDKGVKSVAYIDLLMAKIAELEARLEKLEN